MLFDLISLDYTPYTDETRLVIFPFHGVAGATKPLLIDRSINRPLVIFFSQHPYRARSISFVVFVLPGLVFSVFIV